MIQFIEAIQTKRKMVGMVDPSSVLPFIRTMLRRSRRVFARRWRRAMILPEMLLILAVLIFGNTVLFDFKPGQGAHAAVGTAHKVVSDDFSKRDVRGMQAQLRKEPSALASLNDIQLSNVFFYADLEREEGMMKLMQFRGNGCVLHVMMDMGAGSVSHYEFNPRQTAFYDGGAPVREPVNARECVSDILKSRRA